ncbi:hypothetical protein JW960_14975 [candidate division KSB1 bacterium]|nr:hypothetical protein [candidate division KSB1 bacterium]
MNLLFRIANLYIPNFIKKRELKKLFRLTATAFGETMPSLDTLNYDKCLAEYAQFSQNAVDHFFAQGKDIQPVQEQLFRLASEYGTLWRKRFAVVSIDDVMQAASLLYRTIGIDFWGTERGDIKISTCFFSSFYSPQTCIVISSLDAGIMAGLSDGATLLFTRRITEGFDTCCAHLKQKEFHL